jgi:hypothetical protein
MSDEPPAGAVASADDFQVQRDESGDLLPVWERIPGVRNDCPECEGEGNSLTDSEESEVPEFVTCDRCTGEGEVDAYAKVVPLEQGAAEKYLPRDGDPSNISDRKTVKLLNQRFVEPNFELDVSDAETELDDFTAFGVEPLILCIYNASGFEMAKGMVLDNAELADAIEGNSKTGS